ncbi:radical SAM/SPASM domain-containing protein [Ammonifex thiophilus]|uniref:Radical SAM protein n=1 Tax=Ammonifex thiophilus TaxID=444093 RepID=A0A3D8P753_9THEO|nr:radical SAM protein [Ammonifex thiophilus]RDV84255.1 radical SAM protein [Ammonifex thiophilus]
MVDEESEDNTTARWQAPDSLIWLITSRCNLSCRTCYVAERFASEPELDTAAAERMLDEALDMGVEYVGFTGGEALLRPDVFQLMARSRARGVRTTVVTNGLALTEEVAARLSALGVEVYLSVDGVKAETHEMVRGRGTWEKVQAAAARLRQAGVKFYLVMALGTHNAAEAPAFPRLASSWGARAAIYLPVMPAGKARRDMTLTSPALCRVVREVEREAEKLRFPVWLWCLPFAGLIVRSPYVYYYSCRACTELDVGPAGEVLLCDVLDMRLGNVREGLARVWARQAKHPLVRALAEPQLSSPCLDCPVKEECAGGCFARAYLMKGDLLAPDPLCPRVAASQVLERRGKDFGGDQAEVGA